MIDGFLPNLTFLDSLYISWITKLNQGCTEREKEKAFIWRLPQHSVRAFQRHSSGKIFLAPKGARNCKFGNRNHSRMRRQVQELVPESMKFQEAFDGMKYGLESRLFRRK